MQLPGIGGAVRTAIWLLLGVLVGVPLLASVQLPVPQPALHAFTVLVIALAAWRPVAGLAVLAALLPLSSIMSSGGLWRDPGRWDEVLVLATLAGVLARGPGVLRGSGDERRLAIPALLLGIVVLASCVVELVTLRAVLEPARFTAALARLPRGGYFTDIAPLTPVLDTMRVLEGLGLLLVAVRFASPAEARRRLAFAFVAGATAAAVLNVVRLLEILLRAGDASALGTVLGSLRINVHYGDLNAAGSFFALALFVAVFYRGGSRLERAASAGAAMLIAGALVLTGSRAAVAAALLCGAWAALARAARRRQESRMALGATAVLVCLLIVAGAISVRGQGTAGAFSTRVEMAAISFRMFARAPVFGIGIGRYYDASADFISESAELRKYYRHENAHNNYLQVLAELGITGFVLLIWLLSAAGARSWRLHRASPDPIRTGILLGLSAFALTAVVGHPLLTREVSASFWLMLGVGAAGPAAVKVSRSSRAPHVLVAAAAIVLFGLVPYRSEHKVARADLRHVQFGFGSRVDEGAGHVVRQVSSGATFFVDARASAVLLWLRLDREIAQPIYVEAIFDGRLVNRLALTDRHWKPLRLLAPSFRDRAFHRVELRLSGDTTAARVLTGDLEIRGDQ